MFSKKNNMYVPTLPKLFRPLTRNLLIFFIWTKSNMLQIECSQRHTRQLYAKYTK